MKKIYKTFLVCVLFIFIALGSKVIVDDTNSYISGPLYGDNSIFCRTYCVRGEKCTRNIGAKQIPICTPVCGDGLIVKGKEECDDGNNLSGDGCSNCKVDQLYGCTGEPSICHYSCGNNIYEPQNGEKCDNGNSETQDGCSNTCQISDQWQCLQNVVGFPSICRRALYCGDGKMNQQIQKCDDGNNLNGDGCSNTCKIQEHWECTSEGFGFISTCKYVPYCGDGIINQQIQKCDDGNNIDYDGCSATCEVVQTCIIDLEGKKYCYWDCTALYFEKYGPEQIYQEYWIKPVNLNRFWCNDYNSIAGDGCTKCKVDDQYTCLNLASYGQQSYGISYSQFETTRISFCTNCLVNPTNPTPNEFWENQCPPVQQAKCGDFILSEGQQCQGITGCINCKILVKTPTQQQILQLFTQLITKLQIIKNDTATVYTSQDVLSIYTHIYELPPMFVFSSPWRTVIYMIEFQASSYQEFYNIPLSYYTYQYIPFTKSKNLGFHNFTMTQVKYFMEANNCSISDDKQMFDNAKLFTNLLICTYNLYSFANGLPNLKYDNSVPLMKQFVENVLNATFKQFYQFMMRKMISWNTKLKIVIQALRTKQQFEQDVRNKVWETQGINEEQFMKIKLLDLYTQLNQENNS